MFYGPVWFVIFLTFFIYARVGIFIFQQRRRLNKYIVSDSTLEIQPYRSRETGTQDSEPPGYSRREHHDSTGEQASPSSHGLWDGGGDQFDMSTASPEAVAAWAYSKYAALLFVALLITWVSQVQITH